MSRFRVPRSHFPVPGFAGLPLPDPAEPFNFRAVGMISCPWCLRELGRTQGPGETSTICPRHKAELIAAD